MRSWLKNPLNRVLLAVVTGAMTWYVFTLVAPYFGGAADPKFFATALLGSVIMHELAHLIAFARHGVACYIVFVVIAGGTSPLDNVKAAALPDTAKAEILLAGMFGNLVAIVIVVLLCLAGVMSGNTAGRIMNLNAGLILFNMIPIAIFDGARFVRVLFRNITPKFGMQLFELMSVPVAVAMMLMLYLRGGVILALPLILFGLYRRARGDNHDPIARDPMTPLQQVFWGVTYTYLVCFAVLIFFLTPKWMYP